MGRLRRVLKRLGRILDRLGGVLERPGRVLERLGTELGASWEVSSAPRAIRATRDSGSDSGSQLVRAPGANNI